MAAEIISSKIKLLPEFIINQIKAGEVIERPKALLKELLENAVDAGSSEIEIHIENNGMDLVSVVDNGEGMSFKDLPYAFCRHATSKLQKFEDLYSLNSYGFRGEALASMASISRLTCNTISKKDSNGGKIVIDGGKTVSLVELTKQNKTHGTSIYIKDIFFNTPVRLKFIKSKTSEKNALLKIINAFILSNPNIVFTVQWEEKEKDIYPIYKSVRETLEKRVTKIFYKKNKQNIEPKHFLHEYENYKIEGFISTSSNKGHAGKKQLLFANKRLIEDRSLHSTILHSAQGLWDFGENGDYVVFLDIPQDKVDVNVHPNKSIVKFANSSIVYSLISSSIKKMLESCELKHTAGEQPRFFNTSFNSSNGPNNINCGYENDLYDVTDDKVHLLTQVSEKYLIIRFNLELYILNTPLFFGNFFEELFLNSNEIKDNQLIPLLISRPFKVLMRSFDHYIESFKNYGFEFERLNENVVALKTIPEFMQNYSFDEMIGDLITYFSQNDSFEFEELITRYFKKDPVVDRANITAGNISEIIEKKGLDNLIDKKIIKIFDNKAIEKIFSYE